MQRDEAQKNGAPGALVSLLGGIAPFGLAPMLNGPGSFNPKPMTRLVDNWSSAPWMLELMPRLSY